MAHSSHSDCHQILPGLYLGSFSAVSNLPWDVKRIINCAAELDYVVPAQIKLSNYLKINLQDTGDYADRANFYLSIPVVLNFLNQVPLQQSPVLIHCQQGVSRSASMTAAYLLSQGYFNNLNINQRLDAIVYYIVSRRPVAFFGGNNQTYREPLLAYFG